MKLNAVSISVLHGDLTDDAPPDIDVVLVGDLFYAADLAERVTAFLDRCLQCGARAFVGDPWRAHLPTSRLTELAHYLVPDVGSQAAKPSGVFEFAPRSSGGGQSP